MPSMLHLLFAQEGKSAVMSFLDHWGNAASVLGLVISVISFLAAMWSVCRVKTATREALSKAGALLLTGQTTLLMRLITEARDAGADGLWPRAIDRCQQARLIIVGLCRHPHLRQPEQEALRQAADDLALMRRSIENASGTPGAAQLSNRQKRVLDQMETMVGDIVARLQAGAMEV